MEMMEVTTLTVPNVNSTSVGPTAGENSALAAGPNDHVASWIRELENAKLEKPNVVISSGESTTPSMLSDDRQTEATDVSRLSGFANFEQSGSAPDEDDFQLEVVKQAYDSGREAFEKEEWQEADALFQEALELTHELPIQQRPSSDINDLKYHIAACAYHLQQPAEAEKALLGFVQITPTSDKHRHNLCQAGHLLAQTYVKNSSLDLARSTCESTLKGRRALLGKQHAECYESLALLSRICELNQKRAQAVVYRKMIPSETQQTICDKYASLTMVQADESVERSRMSLALSTSAAENAPNLDRSGTSSNEAYHDDSASSLNRSIGRTQEPMLAVSPRRHTDYGVLQTAKDKEPATAVHDLRRSETAPTEQSSLMPAELGSEPASPKQRAESLCQGEFVGHEDQLAPRAGDSFGNAVASESQISSKRETENATEPQRSVDTIEERPDSIRAAEVMADESSTHVPAPAPRSSPSTRAAEAVLTLPSLVATRECIPQSSTSNRAAEPVWPAPSVQSREENVSPVRSRKWSRTPDTPWPTTSGLRMKLLRELDIPFGGDAAKSIIAQDSRAAESLVRSRRGSLSLNGASALHLAALFGELDLAIELVRCHAEVNASFTLPIDMKRSRDKVTPLHFAIGARHDAMVRFLIEKGAIISGVKGQSAAPVFLLWHNWLDATIAGDPEEVIKILRTLLSLKWDINAHLFPSRYTMLHYAAMIPDTRARLRNTVVKFLLESGASVAALNDIDRVPLHVAAGNNSGGETTRLLLAEDSSKCHYPDKQGDLPIHVAVRNHALNMGSIELDIIYCLCEAGSPVDAKNKDSHTPLTMAEFYKDDAAARLLFKYFDQRGHTQGSIRSMRMGSSFASKVMRSASEAFDNVDRKLPLPNMKFRRNSRFERGRGLLESSAQSQIFELDTDRDPVEIGSSFDGMSIRTLTK